MAKSEWKKVLKKDTILSKSDVATLRYILEDVQVYIEEVGPRDLRDHKEDVERMLEKLK